MHQKMSMKLQEFSLLKFGQWLLKYFLPHLPHQTGVSAKCFLVPCVNTLCRGITSHCFKLGGPLGVALDMVTLGGETSVGSGE